MIHWLTDDRGRDQFVIRFGSETEVYWNDARLKRPDPFYHRSVSVYFNGDNVLCEITISVYVLVFK